MSFSAYDIFMRLESMDPSSTSSLPSSSSPSSSTPLSVHDSDILSEESNAVLFTSHEFVHLNENNNNVDVTNQEEGEDVGSEFTILSSKSSNSGLAAGTIYRLRGGGYAVTPSDDRGRSSNISLSTGETQYLPSEIFRSSNMTDGNDEEAEVRMIESIDSDSSASEDDDDNDDGDVAMETNNCDGRQMVVNNNNNNQRKNCSSWYDRVVSESDWEDIRSRAHDILQVIMKPKPENYLIPRPPDPPLFLGSSTDHPCVPYNATDHVAKECVCLLCNDVIVGAIKLDCNCISAMVCSSCWDDDDNKMMNDYNDGNGKCTAESPRYAERMDFVWVDKLKPCPCCNKRVETTTSCHALDVAISQIIRDLSDSEMSSSHDGKVRSLRQNYYGRLTAWRATVYEKNEMRSRREQDRQDEYLARLIQEEERLLWQAEENHLSARERCQKTVLQGAIAVMVAAAASIGIFATRR